MIGVNGLIRAGHRFLDYLQSRTKTSECHCSREHATKFHVKLNFRFGYLRPIRLLSCFTLLFLAYTSLAKTV